jgi:hypothetical protein
VTKLATYGTFAAKTTGTTTPTPLPIPTVFF